MSLDPVSLNSFKSRKTLKVGKKTYTYYSLKAAEKNGLKGISKLPFSMKVLLENLLRFEDGRSVTKHDIEGFVTWLANNGRGDTEVGFRPARVLMQDFTGVPAVVDLAAMRDGMKTLKGSADKINPLVPVDLVIDHSVVVDYFGNKQALAENVKREYEQNMERYKFLKWGQSAFENFRVVPPGTGICHQVNLEYLSQTVWTKQEGKTTLAYPDTLVGTDSHTTMVNGLGVLGWGVGGIEAEAAMLGQPQSMLLPEVIGFKMTGKLREGVTATDLVLLVTQMLRKKGVVNKFVEFFGEGLKHLTLADRATIANMAPEYGATCGFFPVDGVTIDYLEFSGRAKDRIALVEKYCKTQGMFGSTKAEPMFTDTLQLDLSSVVSAMAGPNRPEKFAPLDTIKPGFLAALDAPKEKAGFNKPGEATRRVKVEGKNFDIGHGDVVIAAITSCTNTSNPTVLIGAGLLAKKAAALGLRSKPWVKTSFAPGSQVVSEYMNKSGLQKELDKLGFYLVGYGCTTCIGNSGPLDPAISKTINDSGIIGSAVLSGNRNFEGRISPDVQAAYLASPPLVVAYALAGSTQIDITSEPLGTDKKGKPVYLRDIWPTNKEIEKFVRKNITAKMFKSRYADVFKGDTNWRGVPVAKGETYAWDNKSTYVQNPPYFAGIAPTPKAVSNVSGARILGLFGDKITTDHISPAGSIKAASPAGKYL
ncbi:MAG TPA: aconitate hydratase AcnA, partial [Aestuariivirga sp.]